jgi:uncharacterized membrane protein YraQ (UPF0718 family)
MKKKIKDLFSEYTVEIIICLIALILMLFNPHKIGISIIYGLKMYVSLFLIILSVAFLSSFISEVVPPSTIMKIIGKESGWRGVISGAFFGTFMIGPAYVFYPFFRELIDKGATVNIIATIIGAWAIKVQFIPFAISLMGWKYVLLLNLFLFVYSILSGIIVGFFVKK